MTNISLHIWLSLISLFTLSIFSGCPSNPENPTETQVYRKNSTENSFRILILGDSLTEGYGVSAQQAFPSLLEKKLNDEFSSDKNRSYEIINAGISGSTSSGGVSRIEWLLKSKPDFLILALGGMMDFVASLSKRLKITSRKSFSQLNPKISLPYLPA